MRRSVLRTSLAVVAALSGGMPALPAMAAAWGLEIHQGIESVGLRNARGELFSFVCDYDHSHPGMLGVEFEIAHQGQPPAPKSAVTVTVPGAAPTISFEADLDNERDLTGVSTYAFDHAKAKALIGLVSKARRVIVSVTALGTHSVFDATGGQKSWRQIDCKF